MRCNLHRRKSHLEKQTTERKTKQRQKIVKLVDKDEQKMNKKKEKKSNKHEDK